MAEVVIDIDWVMNQVTRLEVVKGGLENDVKEAQSYEWAMGSGDVARAMEYVTRDWGQQKQVILKQLKGLIDATRNAAQTFHELDQRQSDGFSGRGPR
ncbi:MAG: hypothetical protein ACJ73S_29055 [Mycobacteriales bacterium]|jgi:hypothetical protein